MTDLEMTKLCAEAAGYRAVIAAGHLAVTEPPERLQPFGVKPEIHYDPLHDDAQAMALVKRFKLWLQSPSLQRMYWFVASNEEGFRHDIKNSDLNRAIVECVAKMQGGKRAEAV